jgi:hypothetical protein
MAAMSAGDPVIRCTLGVNHHPVVIVEATEAAEVVAAVRPPHATAVRSRP